MISGKVMTVVPQGDASTPSPGAVPSGSGDPPAQSQEDKDTGWGEQPDPEHDERLRGERPPHWDSV